MKYLIHITSLTLLTTLAGCTGAQGTYKSQSQFDWMPHPVVWEHNIRTCRSQPQCNAADLFQR